MIPDKIYVREYPDGLNQFWDRKKRDDVVATIYHEFIRKDALLEWLEIAVECYSHPDTENVVDTIRCEGKKWAIQDVINKIESL